MQDIQWVRSDPSQFITWGSDIRHYNVVVRPPETVPNSEHVLNETHVAVHVATLQDPQFVRAVDIWPGESVCSLIG